LFSILAAGLISIDSYLALVMGGIFAQFASVIDGCDGEVARLKFQTSDYGKWLDAVLDRYADAFLLFGLTWHAYADKTEGLVLFVGFLAIIGSFLLSYTADKYDHLMSRQIHQGKGIRVGRDIRIFIIFLGAVLHLPFWALLVIAVMMNLEIIRRLIVCRDHE
jgi:CDP-L-myo-inositol myo-inositolphosphotransferase